MNLEVLREAEAELNEAVAHYEEMEPGRGLHLKEEVRKTLAWIQEHPELPRLRSKGYRRVNTVWTYTTTASLPTGQAVSIEVTATDRPGHKTTKAQARPA